jgi:type I restriction enzyme M protein
MARLPLAKLERHLMGAADILRTQGMDVATYKDYIFGLLFLKRCSDVFTQERQRWRGNEYRTPSWRGESCEEGNR